MQKLTHMNRSNLEYIDQLYVQFKQDPAKIPHEWRLFFEGVEFGQNSPSGSTASPKEVDVFQLMQAYRHDGHLQAQLNPLAPAKPSARLSLQNFRLSEKDLETSFNSGSLMGLANAKLKDILATLNKNYCQTLALDVSHASPEVRSWFYREFEKAPLNLSVDQKKQVLEQLNRADALEKFIHTRYVATKRFSIEGGDSLIPMLERFVTMSPEMGVNEFVLGMAHRGRVNVLANFMGKAIETIFSEFDGHLGVDETYDGDVKYHMGFFHERRIGPHKVDLTLAFNPSHLEAVNPVVCGMTRAKQRIHQDTQKRKKVIPILIHGDAAFAGQGVVMETLQMSQIKGYTVGGTIHIIIDNQVGFTADPEDTRSTRYASDPAKAIGCPVLHVNGDDVEACVRAADMAMRFRQEFGQDVVINLVCYRRFGHNEADEPAFTQPKMYDLIKNHPTPRHIYAQKLMQEKVVTEPEFENLFKTEIDRLQSVLDKVRKKYPEVKPLAFEGLWKGFRKGKKEDFDKSPATGAKLADLKKVGKIICSYPDGFKVHPKLEKLIESRRAMVEKTEVVDWGMAELLSYGTLLNEGTSVRVSGQDCGRGTFSHRHSIYANIETGESYNPLNPINPEKEFCVYDSLLSEMGVLGFEYGNSIYDPTFLTIWEAQFGDFSNGAQIMIDQFISSGEYKWYRMSGLVLLLPHGYEGQGPEHSSARLERYLQLCAQENIQVCNMTTPAQIFHVLRRQIKRDFRKPLIVMSPKSLLRHPKVVSPLKDLADGIFQEVLPDPNVQDPKKVEKVVLCSGKLYYDILEAREKKGADNFAVIRIEQLYPFPKKQLMEQFKNFPKLRRLVWAQEEPQNMGAFSFIIPRLKEVMDEMGLSSKIEFEYVGRPEKASPATGSPYIHKAEQEKIVEGCLKPL